MRHKYGEIPILAQADAPFTDSSRKIFDLLATHINPWQEELWIVAFNASLQVVAVEMVFRGTAESCMLHPRDVFRILILANASFFAMAHNHPSGSSVPSPQDEDMTQKLFEAGRLMQILLLDHLVLGDRKYYSFADAGRINGKTRRSPCKLPRAATSRR